MVVLAREVPLDDRGLGMKFHDLVDPVLGRDRADNGGRRGLQEEERRGAGIGARRAHLLGVGVVVRAGAQNLPREGDGSDKPGIRNDRECLWIESPKLSVPFGPRVKDREHGVRPVPGQRADHTVVVHPRPGRAIGGVLHKEQSGRHCRPLCGRVGADGLRGRQGQRADRHHE